MEPKANPTRPSRRTAMRLLGVGAGFGIVAAWEGAAVLDAAPQSGSADRRVSFPRGAVIRTLLKDISPESLTGATLVHEHLSLTNWMTGPDQGRRRWFADVDFVADEVRAAGKEGISCLVDVGNVGMGRNLEHLKRIAASSGVHIVGSAGYYSQRNYPPEIARMTEDQIAESLIQEVTSGHLGVFGQIGTSAEITPDERKVFRAVGKAHLRTALPIVTHIVADTNALDQLDLLTSVGVPPEKIFVGKLDSKDNPELHAAVAKRGAFCGFDAVGSGGPERDAMRVRNVLKLLEAGYGEKLILSSDFNLENKTKRRGGPGYALVVTEFVPKLRRAGVPQDVLHGIVVDNPRRLLAFIPKNG